MNSEAEFHEVKGLLAAPYLYFIVLDDRIYIDTSMVVPFASWAKELTQKGNIAKSLQAEGGRLAPSERVFVFGCRCLQIERQPVLAKRRQLDILGTLMFKCCVKSQRELDRTYEILSRYEKNPVTQYVRGSEEWLGAYAKTIFATFSKAITRSKEEFCIMACQ